MKTRTLFLMLAFLWSFVFTEAQVFKSDFLVNDDVSSDLQQEDPPRVARNEGGDFVVVWADERNGDLDIFFQRFDDLGMTLGGNFRVNDDAGEEKQENPAVAMDRDGNFVVVWEDGRTGEVDIMVQRFDDQGNPLGSNVRVNDDTLPNATAYLPGVAMDPENGDFVVVWNDTRENSDHHVWAQRFSANGTPLGSNFKVNEAGEVEPYRVAPGAGMDANGNFVVVWTDNRVSGVGNVFGQRYAANGSAQGSNFLVNDTTATGATLQRRPAVAMNHDGKFVVGWEDFRSGSMANPDIYAQRFAANGSYLGGNFRVNDDTGTKEQLQVTLGINEDAGFVIAWYDKRSDVGGDIYARWYDENGQPLGSDLRIDDDNGRGIQEYPAVAMEKRGNAVFVWRNDSGPDDILGIRYDDRRMVDGAGFRVNDDTGSCPQQTHAIAMNNLGAFVIVWQDERSDPAGDIYLQRYSRFGNPQGPNVKVNDENGFLVRQVTPHVAINDKGDFVVVWMDARRNNFNDIYAQRYRADGTAEGGNFAVNEDTIGSTAAKGFPTVGMAGDGSFVVAWHDNRDDDDIYARRFNPMGVASDTSFKVNDDAFQHNQNTPCIAMNTRGDWVVVWFDERLNQHVYGQRYAADGSALGANFKISDHSGRNYPISPSVSIDDAGAFVVTWPDERNGALSGAQSDIFAQRFDKDGVALGSNFQVNEVSASKMYNKRPSVAVDPAGGRFVVFWTDLREGDGDPEVMAQRYDNGVAQGGNVQVNQPDLFPYNHQHASHYALAANSQTVAYVWQDNRRHKSWDIYGKLTDWSLMVGLEEVLSLPRLRLYPNPFAGEVRAEGVKGGMEVFDLNGRRLATPSGSSWDGRTASGEQVPAGIYIVKAPGFIPARVVKTR